MTRASRQRGFTLLETVAVLLIVALLAGAVMLSPSQWFQSARLKDAADRVVFMDRVARQHAQRSGQAVDLVFDIEHGKLYRRQSQGGESGREKGHRLSMPSGFEMEKIIVHNRQNEWGQANVPFSKQGHTPSYAVRITGPNDQATWLVVAGLTGQVLEFDSQDEVEDVFEQLSS